MPRVIVIVASATSVLLLIPNELQAVTPKPLITPPRVAVAVVRRTVAAILALELKRNV